jgi:hypothetical protein
MAAFGQNGQHHFADGAAGAHYRNFRFTYHK